MPRGTETERESLHPLRAALRRLVAGGALLLTAAGMLAAVPGTGESSFRWNRDTENKLGEVRVVTLKMRSQTWRGIPWDHAVQIYLPPRITHADTALLLITGGNPGNSSTLLAATIAPRLEAPTVILYNIPNQPLFNGKTEDDLIAHTFEEFLASGDESWPLLLPMAESARRAMDAVQQWSREHHSTPIKKFVVTGASKRGWTTYLTGASDSRVAAIAPMVFDTLNIPRQMPHQLSQWGKYSEQIDDYSRRGLQQQFDTPRGRRLLAMVDPWFHRERLTMPKLLIHGANDRYWATDATRLYWDGLKGDKYLLAVPNSGHGLEDRNRVLNTLSAFFHAVAAGKKLPKLKSKVKQNGGSLKVELAADRPTTAARAWTARAPDLDFRPLKFAATELNGNGKAAAGDVNLGSERGLALLLEADFEQDGRKFSLTLPPQVFDQRKL